MANLELIYLNESLGHEGNANCAYQWDYKLRFPEKNNLHRIRKSTKKRISKKLGKISFNDTLKFVHKFRYPEGFYTGEMCEGNREGFGIMKFMTGIKYYGQWSQDSPDGIGFLKINSKTYYKGSFIKGKF